LYTLDCKATEADVQRKEKKDSGKVSMDECQAEGEDESRRSHTLSAPESSILAPGLWNRMFNRLQQKESLTTKFDCFCVQ